METILVKITGKFKQDTNRPRPKWWDNYVGEEFMCYDECKGWWRLTPEGVEKLTKLSGKTSVGAIIHKEYGEVVKAIKTKIDYTQPYNVLEKLVPKERQLDMLTGAIEGGSNYWYYIPDLSMLPALGYTPVTEEVAIQDKKSNLEPNAFSNCIVNRIWEAVMSGKVVPVHDAEDEDNQLGSISIKNLQRGLCLMAEKYPSDFADVMKEDDDANTADVWFQLVVMGEVVYG